MTEDRAETSDAVFGAAPPTPRAPQAPACDCDPAPDTDLDLGAKPSDPSAEGRVAIFRVSHELLARVLMLPPGSEILACSPHRYFDSGALAVKVASPGFPAAREGEALPEVAPTYRAEYTRSGERHMGFAGWDGPHPP